MKNFFDYNKDKFNLLLKNTNCNKELNYCVSIFKKYKKKNKIILVGNGGSAAIASHVSVDLNKNAKIKSLTFNEPSFITCLANDYGHENWMKEALDIYCHKNDLVILISSSGNSKNILKAAKWCVKKKIKLITFSGFSPNNSLIKSNYNGINFWVNSKSYNHVELMHLFLLLSIMDASIGRLYYRFS